MKYPQLVSTRAVNAISEWLVTRLEQLGVEAPQIYTRLLLSLLQSSVQINDPNEFSNLETFFANRKGNNRRHLPCDTDTLKKLNAIQCLKEIVSSEQEIATIENLVDELCEKLKDIEKDLADIEDEENLLVATVSVPNSHIPHHHNQHHHSDCTNSNSNKHHRREEEEPKEGTATILAAAAAVVDSETDPKKRYFRAFPALTKDMEDSFRIWRRNAKSLTWPMDRNNLCSVSSSSSSSTISTSFGSEGAAKAAEDCVETKVDATDNLSIAHVDRSNKGLSGGFSNLNNLDSSTLNSGGVKRKSKRRRNQALSKGKTIQNIRKNSISNTAVGGGSTFVGVRYQRNYSPTYWDTDFEGCWEMGRDLIKEFIVKQNRNCRNRSTSESAAYGRGAGAAVDNRRRTPPKQVNKNEHKDDDLVVDKASGPSSPVLPVVDISFCCDDDFDDTLGSVSDLQTDTSLSAIVPRRLYQRDISYGSRELLPDSTKASDDNLAFAQLEAKFNSSVEALWKDAEPPIAANKKSNMGSFSFGPSSLQPTSMPSVAPFREDLKNFWTKYYNHHFDLAKIPQQLKQAAGAAAGTVSKSDENCVGLSCNGSVGTLNADVAHTSDYYSMPSNLNDFDRSVGSMRRDIGGGACCNHYTPIGLFLQNSIWSETSNTGSADTDESFYFKVWNSTHKLNQLDAIHGGKITALDGSKTYEDVFNFPPYNVQLPSKWSEGINAGPTMQQQMRIQIDTASATAKNINNMKLQIDCTDTNVVTTTSCSSSFTQSSGAYSWQTPVIGQTLQADMQSWSQSNPISLTEMYGGISGVNVTATAEMSEPQVTLSNHSPTTSGFIEYARIKSVTKIIKHESVNTVGYPPDMLRPKERYPDDENLLTSERTHFHPIKAYSDGHTFDICSALDDIDYERSASGYLYLETEKYLEYTRNDNLMVEEDGMASAAPLYATSNCEAAHACSGLGTKNQSEKEFKIKFRIRNCEIACQTEEDAELVEAAHKHAAQIKMLKQHPLCVIFASPGKGPNVQSGGQACNDAIEALNKAVAAAAAASCLSADNDTFSAAAAANGAFRHTSIWTAVQPPLPDENCCDEVDFYAAVDAENASLYSGNSLEQQWSMRAIGKNCQLKGHINMDNNNLNASLLDDTHSLWGMCAACNSEFKSVPANRKLRDELEVEADEIMSDLKYMQDLYIGRAGDGASESDLDADEELDESVEMPINVVDASCKESQENMKEVEDDATMQADEEFTTDDKDPQQPKTQEVLQKVNRFIADLLQPENASNDLYSIDAALAAAAPKPFSGSLWFGNNEQNIWQQNDTQSNALKPMELLRRHFNVEPHTDTMQAEKDKFLSQLSWEHDNLAEIWHKTSPLEQDRSPPPPTTPIHAIGAFAGNSNALKIFRPEMENETDFDDKIADKNFKNIQVTLASTPLIADSASSTLSLFDQLKTQTNAASSTGGVAFKRVQQFLNSSVTSNAASKLKLPNRKRRHSASQNFFHNSQINSSTNNNSIDVADLNSFNFTLNSTSSTTSADFNDDIDLQKFINTSLHHAFAKKSNSNNDDVDDMDAGISGGGEGFKQPKQTIITCKYWTTIDPMPGAGDLLDGATFSCLIDKNASILKHVTMVTRPLTR